MQLIDKARLAVFIVAASGIAIGASLAPTVTPPPVEATTKPKRHRSVVDDEDKPNPSRTVHYRRGDTVQVKAQKRFATAVQIQNEKIVKVVGGDNGDWAVDLDGDNTVIVFRPKNGAPRNSRTSLVVTTTKNNIYLIGLTLSSTGHDELITITPDDKDMKEAAAGTDKFVPASMVDGLKSQLSDKDQQIEKIQAETDKRVTEANARVAEVAQREQDEIAQFKVDYPGMMSFGYRFKRDRGPFYVESVWHDDKFTYIKADPDEVCAVYAEIDGQSKLIDAPYKKGVFTIPMVVHGDFYLQAGRKHKLMIEREDRGK